MTVETDSDRLTMLKDFGEQVTFSPGAVWPNRADTTQTVWMIFDREFIELTAERAPVTSSIPVCMARSSDVENAARNSVVERPNGDMYKVTQVQDDGTGITVLELEGPR